MTDKSKRYSSTETKKIIADYIDQSAVRLSQKLKKAYSVQKKQSVKARAYA